MASYPTDIQLKAQNGQNTPSNLDTIRIINGKRINKLCSA